jgi:hypothetical protein
VIAKNGVRRGSKRQARDKWRRASTDELCDPDRDNVAHTLPAPGDRLYSTKMRSSKEAGRGDSQFVKINCTCTISVQPLDGTGNIVMRWKQKVKSKI